MCRILPVLWMISLTEFMQMSLPNADAITQTGVLPAQEDQDICEMCHEVACEKQSEARF